MDNAQALPETDSASAPGAVERAVGELCRGLVDACAARIDHAALLARATTGGLLYASLLALGALLLAACGWLSLMTLMVYWLATWWNVTFALATAIIVNVALALMFVHIARGEFARVRARLVRSGERDRVARDPATPLV